MAQYNNISQDMLGQPNGVPQLNGDGEIEGPIVARESTGSDVPAAGEVVVSGGRLAVGDNATVGGVPAVISGDLAASFGAMHVPGGVTLLSRGYGSGDTNGGNVFIYGTCSNSGNLVVQWGDDSYDVGGGPGPTTTDARLKLIRAYPELPANSITALSLEKCDIVAMSLAGCNSLTTLTIDYDEKTEYLNISGLQALTTVNLTVATGLKTLIASDLPGPVNIQNAVSPNLVEFLDLRRTNLLGITMEGATNLTSVLTEGITASAGATIVFAGCGLTAEAIDDIMTDLPVVGEPNSDAAQFVVVGCPGATTCTPSIGTTKGWQVYTE